MKSPQELHRDWLIHRERVRNMKSDIDNLSPTLHVTRLLNSPGIRLDSDNYTRILKLNFRLLVGINKLQHTKGYVDTFSPLPTGTKRNMNIAYKRIRAIEKANRFLGDRLLNIKCEVESHQKPIAGPFGRVQKKKKVEKKSTFQLPVDLLKAYIDENTKWTLPSSPSVQQKMLYPRVYIDLAVKDLRTLGRLIIELHTLASPQVVMEFFKICASGRAGDITFNHLFSTLWLSGDFAVQPSAAMNEKVNYQLEALDHATGPGILSYPLKALEDSHHIMFSFTISFKPLAIVNGKRVAFGQVVGGLKILESVTAYGTKHGKLIKPIEVSRCGLVST